MILFNACQCFNLGLPWYQHTMSVVWQMSSRVQTIAYLRLSTALIYKIYLIRGQLGINKLCRLRDRGLVEYTPLCNIMIYCVQIRKLFYLIPFFWSLMTHIHIHVERLANVRLSFSLFANTHVELFSKLFLCSSPVKITTASYVDLSRSESQVCTPPHPCNSSQTETTTKPLSECGTSKCFRLWLCHLRIES